MVNFLISLSPLVFTLAITGTTVLIAISGLLLVRKYLPLFFIVTEDTTVANIFIRQISTLLAVLLAFVVISIWRNYEEQRENTGKEASSLGNLYRDSRGLKPEAEIEIQQLITKYTRDVVYDGWPAMLQGRESRIAWLSFNQLYGKVVRYSPENAREEIVYAHLVDEMNDLAMYRRLRMIRNANPFMPDVLWAVIYIGSLLVIVTGYFLKISNKKVHLLLTTINSVMLGLIFSVMLLLNFPYRGSLQISVYPLENLLKDVYPMAKITDATLPLDTLDPFRKYELIR